VVELREDQSPGGQHQFNVMAQGQPAVAKARLVFADREERVEAPSSVIPDFASLRLATFELPATGAHELKVWGHTITPEGVSVPLPAVLTVRSGNVEQELDLAETAGTVLLPFDGQACRLDIRLGEVAG
jgi:hypothetical protein